MNRIFAIGAVACLLTVAGCADKDTMPESGPETPSAVDTKPFKLEAYIDSTVHPGDNMFQYGYGHWLDTAKAGKRLCDYNTVLAAKQKRITDTLELTHYAQCRSEYLAAAREGRVLREDSLLSIGLRQAMSDLKRASNEDEIVRVWAQCMREGYLLPAYFTLGCCEKGICLSPSFDANESGLQPTTRSLEATTEAPEGMRCRVIDHLMKEMGISLDLVRYNSPNDMAYMMKLDGMSIKDLKSAITSQLSKLDSLTCPALYTTKQVDKAMKGTKLYARFLDICEYDPIGLWATQEENDAVRKMVGEIREALGEHIGDLDWMSGTTKSKAIEKVQNMAAVVVGAIDSRGQKLFASMAGETLCTSYVKKNKALLDASLSLLGKERTEERLFYMLEFSNLIYGDGNLRETINAFYFVPTNSIIICPIMGSTPLVDLTQTAALLYGGLGHVVGHELTHGIDHQGSAYGKYGTVENWWTDNDYQTFTERTLAVIYSYSSMDAFPEFFPNVKNNGTKTLNENIADIGGIEVVLLAYRKHLTRQGFKGEELDKCLRKFFISCGYAPAMKLDQTTAMKLLKLDDVHSLGSTRMGGMCRNCDEWYRLFNVEPSHKLYLSPERRCRIW